LDLFQPILIFFLLEISGPNWYQHLESAEHLAVNLVTSKLDLQDIIATFRRDPQRPKRMSFIAAREPALAEQVLKLLQKK